MSVNPKWSAKVENGENEMSNHDSAEAHTHTTQGHTANPAAARGRD